MQHGRIRQRAFLAAFLAVLAACGPSEDGEETRRGTPSPNVFDPETIEIGDTLLGLRVVSVDVRRAVGDTVWVGDVHFEGPVELAGTYRAHFDYPGIPEARFPCFEVDSDSVQRLPRFPDDRRRVWFCFENESFAEEQLGPVGTVRPARIIVDSYHTGYHFSDAFDTAELVRVIEAGRENAE